MLNKLKTAIRRKIALANIRKHKGPFYLTLFVTNRCNLRCAHCFYHSEIAGSKFELTAEDVAKFMPSLKNRLASVIITGGEPTLHPELPEICRIIGSQTKCSYIDLDTNGVDTKLTVSQVEAILQKTHIQLNVQLSLDGFEQTHNTIRNCRDGFRKTLATLEGLLPLCRKNALMSVTALTTVNMRNYKEVLDFRRFITSTYPVRHNVSLVRGTEWGIGDINKNALSGFTPPDPNTTLPPLEELEKIYGSLYNSKEPLDAQQETQRRKLRLSLDILKCQKRIIPCLAGYIDGVIYPNLDAAICEPTNVIGNLKDYDYDFNKLWLSKSAEDMRRKTKKCYCIHSCNILHSLKYSNQ